MGKQNPNATPSAWVANTILSAMTLSFSPNHTATSLAGRFKKNGYEKEHKN